MYSTAVVAHSEILPSFLGCTLPPCQGADTCCTASERQNHIAGLQGEDLIHPAATKEKTACRQQPAAHASYNNVCNRVTHHVASGAQLMALSRHVPEVVCVSPMPTHQLLHSPDTTTVKQFRTHKLKQRSAAGTDATEKQ